MPESLEHLLPKSDTLSYNICQNNLEKEMQICNILINCYKFLFKKSLNI